MVKLITGVCEVKTKFGTITLSYSRNSQMVLSDLLVKSGSRKTVVTYNNEFQLTKDCNVIYIYRQPSGEYAGVLNFYKVVQ